ncbi:hypothetical protein [Mucilaginibacter antarcticus]|uniref:DoxX-like protein n=1 Tax=Mucilaginibacter antarcticus TaxID=1855725 RepID=A0ABW5XM07_9SPHI
MISTLYFIQFVAFYLWQLSAKSAKGGANSTITAKIISNKKAARILGAVLLLITAVGFVCAIGLLSGLCGFVVGLMGVGCLSVVLEPFNYLRLPGVVGLYFCCVALEILI